MGKILYVILLYVVAMLILFLITFVAMWVGNRFLVDIGVETAGYWSWFCLLLVFGFFITNSRHK